MRLFMTLLAVFLPIAIAETERFKADVVSGKAKLKCTFSMVYTGTKVDIKKSSAKCSGAKSTTKVSNAEITSSSGTVFTINMTVPKNGKAKFQRVSMILGFSGGQGSGNPPGKGSGSGSPPSKGSGGPGGPPGQGSGGSGGGSGNPPSKGSGSGTPPGKGSGGPGGPPGKGSGGPGGPPGKGSGGPGGQSGQGSGGLGGLPGNGSGAPGQGSGGPPANAGMMKCRCKCLCPNGSEDCECECDCPTGQTSSRKCGRGFSRVCPSLESGECPARMVSLCDGSMGLLGGMGGVSGQGPNGGGSGGPTGPQEGSGQRPPPKGRQIGSGQGPPPGNGVGTEVAAEGCTCVPNVLLYMSKMAMQGPAGQEGLGGMSGPPSGRAGTIPDKFDTVVKNGKTTLKCSFTLVFTEENVDTRKSKAKCSGAKKTEKVKNARIKSSSGAEYSISMTVAKTGKVTLSKVLVTKAAENQEPGQGSGGPGGPTGQGSGGSGPPSKGSGSGNPPGKGSGGPGGPPGKGSGGPGGPGVGSGGPGPGQGSGRPIGNGQEGLDECACVDDFIVNGNGPPGPGQGSGGPGQGSGGPGQGSGGPGQGSGGPGQGSGGPGQGSGGPGQGSEGPGQGSGEPGTGGSGTGTTPGPSGPTLPNPGSAATELTLSISQTWSQEPAGYLRTAKVSVPATTEGQKVPVVIHLHGNGGQGNTQVLGSWLGDDCVIVSADGYERSWNIYTEKSKSDDVGFIVDLIAKVGAEIPAADMNNVNIIGTSNGAALTYSLIIGTGADRPFRRAFPMVSSLISPQYHDSSFWKFTVSAAAGEANVHDTAVVPMFADNFEYAHFHGTEDGALKYEGQSPGPGFLGGADVIAAQETDFLWAKAMGYTGVQLDDSEGVSIGTSDKPVQQYTYLDGKVRHFKLIGEGHSTGPGHTVVREVVRAAILGL